MGPDCEARGVSCDVAVSALQARDSNGISELPLIPKTVEYRSGRSPLF